MLERLSVCGGAGCSPSADANSQRLHAWSPYQLWQTRVYMGAAQVISSYAAVPLRTWAGPERQCNIAGSCGNSTTASAMCLVLFLPVEVVLMVIFWVSALSVGTPVWMRLMCHCWSIQSRQHFGAVPVWVIATSGVLLIWSFHPTQRMDTCIGGTAAPMIVERC